MTTHRLVGRAVHRLGENRGDWRYQGEILDVFSSDTGELVLIQLFSAVTGYPTRCMLVSLADLTGDLSDWVIYDTVKDMREEGERMNERWYAEG